MSKLQEVLKKYGVADETATKILEDMKTTRASNVKFKRTDKKCEQKLAPQASQILEAVTKTPETGETIAKRAVKNGLKTRQEPVRIFAYYKQDLLDAGLIQQVNAS